MSYCIALYNMTSYDIVLYCIVFYDIVSCLITFYIVHTVHTMYILNKYKYAYIAF